MNATNDFVDIQYQQNGRSTTTNELGMRKMQARAYEAGRFVKFFRESNEKVLVCAHVTLRGRHEAVERRGVQ